MGIKLIKKDFILTLEGNAKTSLRHGIRHYLRYMRLKSNRNDLKFAIIHVFHAVELYLKARLVQESPLLIYSRPEEKITEDTHTVQFNPLMSRLANADVNLTKHRTVLESLQKIRNRIEHHQVKSTIPEIKDYIAKAARFLNEFLAAELDVKLVDVVGDTNYRFLIKQIYSYEERLTGALSDVAKKITGCAVGAELLIYICPKCKNKTLTLENKKTHCHFCDEDPVSTICLYCGAPTAVNTSDDMFCDNCRTPW